MTTIIGGSSPSITFSDSTTQSTAFTGLNQSASPYTTSLGYQALNSNTGTNNVAVGYQAGYSITTSNNLTAVGSTACQYQTGSNNTGVGLQALQGSSGFSTGTNNTACGYQAGGAVTTGSNNNFLGVNSGNNITTGSNNTYLGFNIGASSASVVGELVVSSSTTTGKGGNTGYINPNGGGVYQGNNSTTWSFTSDQRLKKNIVTNTDGLNKISQLTVRNFEYRLPEEVDPELKPTDALNISGVQLGFIAQELQAVLPDCVKIESTGVLGVNIDNVIYHMVNAIKDLNTIVTDQATEIAALKAKVGV